jgi:hypothetical protein
MRQEGEGKKCYQLASAENNQNNNIPTCENVVDFILTNVYTCLLPSNHIIHHHTVRPPIRMTA